MINNKDIVFGGVGVLILLLLVGWGGQVAEIREVGLKKDQTDVSEILETKVAEVILPIKWEDRGYRMVEAGIIDKEKMKKLYETRGGWSDNMEQLLSEEGDENLVMTEENAGEWLNILWAMGISNNNPILTEGPMNSEEYGGQPERFASTGGWYWLKGML